MTGTMSHMCRLGWLLLMLSSLAGAEVRLPNMISDHAVLQRDQPIHLWGWAAAGEQVIVEFHGQTQEGVANVSGIWRVDLKPEEAGGPYSLVVTGSATAIPLERHDILMGDVWVASGQSNMFFQLRGSAKAPLKDGRKELANATHPQLRLFNMQRIASETPLQEAIGKWTECTPKNAGTFSAIAYFFGREVSEREDVPVGLIEAAWGGTSVRSWVSEKMLTSKAFNDTQQAVAESDYTRPILQVYAPAILFNGMIAPLTAYSIKGIIWYQGEADTGVKDARNYLGLFTALIRGWRRQWGDPKLPFLYAQISSFEGQPGSTWGKLRDSQRRALSLPHTAMAVTVDVGEECNIHYADKQTVGKRLALAALGSVYGEKIDYASPEFLKAERENRSMRVWFDHAKSLTSRGAPLGGFEVAGQDHRFVSGNAKIKSFGDQQTIVVSAPSIAVPRYVRYGWSNYVNHYVYNGAELPLGTFTSEQPSSAGLTLVSTEHRSKQ